MHPINVIAPQSPANTSEISSSLKSLIANSVHGGIAAGSTSIAARMTNGLEYNMIRDFGRLARPSGDQRFRGESYGWTAALAKVGYLLRTLRLCFLIASTSSDLVIVERPCTSRRRAMSSRCFLLALASTPSAEGAVFRRPPR
ncbi:hypothetical protein MSG_01687 [Mycobacterium shigaense]|uniref:Uncharacterized protein n=1 Tax=Mycobacterium shigaense TaxID=722731 RepID=A0A1Z4EFU1_9MYCO|nr:hypothetical protein MSG_01687 [Mycobacterium shigaense]